MTQELAQRLAEEVESTRLVAERCGAVLRTGSALPERGALAAGVLPTALQIIPAAPPAAARCSAPKTAALAGKPTRCRMAWRGFMR